eukprot:m51a1_g11395 hypothetical protein (236) ;mRNA; r:74-2258
MPLHFSASATLESTSGGAGACKGLSPACASTLPASAAAGIGARCMSSVSAAFLGNMTAAALGRIPASSFGGLGKDSVAGLGVTCTALSDAQIGAIASSETVIDACAGLTRACAQHLPSSSLASATLRCVQHMSADFVSGLSSSHVAAMPATACGGFTAENIAGLRESCAGLDANQTQFLGRLDSACHNLDVGCIAAASVSAFGGFVDTCTEDWREEQALAATLDKVLAIGGRGHA